MMGRRQKAMKSYQCGECGGPIAKGVEYVRDSPPPGSKYYRGGQVGIFCTTCWRRESFRRAAAADPFTLLGR